MICKVCGRNTANDDANFCEYCGASFREMKQTSQTDSPLYKESQEQESVSHNPMYQQNQPDWQGQSTQQGYYQQSQNPNQAQKQAMYQQNMQQSKKEEPVSFLNWLGTMLLPYIPFAGWIAYLVMLFIWAFGRESNPTKKNWARARLLVILISIVITVLFFAYAVGTIVSSGMTLEDYMNSTTYY